MPSDSRSGIGLCSLSSFHGGAIEDRGAQIKETDGEAFYAEACDCEVDGTACVELHVDFLKDVKNAMNSARLLGQNGHYSVRFHEAAAAAREAHHPPAMCKCECGKKGYHMGTGRNYVGKNTSPWRGA